MTITPHYARARSGTTQADRASRLQIALSYCAVVLSGLFAGFLLTVLVLECSMRSESAAVYTQVRLIELEHLDDLATALLIPALLVVGVLALVSLRRRTSSLWLAAIALLLLLAILVISVSVSVPINTMQQGWSVAAPPADWADVRDRWQLAHVARTAIAVLAFLMLIAVPLRSAPTATTSTTDGERSPNVVQ
ncbi:MAG: hypothetical protein QOC58_2789 [Mycobacterium sp.]|jgi:hypothetical protein|nr:hypothetical protein [Mycobacterium sp.]